MDAPRSLYVHVPFCERKCPYCAFNSYAGRDEEGIRAYVAALLRELEGLGDSLDLDTVYIGGGTPTALPAVEFTRLLSAIRSACRPREWTVEVNPGSVQEWHLDAMVQTGVTRVSMGVQSMDAEGLRRMGRIHTADDVVDTVEAVRSRGLEDISLDLIYGQPGQGVGEFLEDVEAVLSLETSHLSLYALQYEEGTVFTRQRDAGRLDEA